MVYADAAGNVMETNGLKCVLNMPRRVEQRYVEGVETTSCLPEYNPRQAFNVDEYPACPAFWPRGSASETSYFVVVQPDHGLWLDFNLNVNSHHVAAVISMQGVNALTALRVGGPEMEQYRTHCPVHEAEFQGDHFCPVCEYKWNPQNYLASNVTPIGRFWLDGFFTEEGVTRQFWFTEEESRGIAAQVIGEERVYAISIAFHLSKEPKPRPTYSPRRYPDYFAKGVDLDEPLFRGFASYRDDESLMELACPRLEIAAGAKIDQRVYPDEEELSFWQPEPAGLLHINYCDQATADAIFAAGRLGADGPLGGLKLGTP